MSGKIETSVKALAEPSARPRMRLAVAGEGMLPWLRNGWRLSALTLAGLHTWAAASSHSMNPDGVNYLDIGDAYMRGDWSNAINSVWSPLYSLILGAVLAVVRPTMQWEFPTVHLVNLAIFVAALLAFEFLWKELAKAGPLGDALGDKFVTWPLWAWWSVGYLLFMWATLSQIQIWAVTPDMLMAVFLFSAGGLLVRIRAQGAGLRTFALLGLALGLGFLSKSVMLPISLLFLAAGFAAAGSMRRALLGTSLALGIFLLIAGPFVLAMSTAKGYFTYGDAGKLTYARHVNGVAYPHWQGEPPGDGTPVHPSRRILLDPPVYEFGTPISGTYPIAYDQTYWYEGVVARIDPANQLRQLLASAVFYVDLFALHLAAVTLSVLAVYGLRRWSRPSVPGMGRALLLSLIGLAALLLYVPVLVEGRYVGALVVLFWSDLLVQARLPSAPSERRLMSVLGMLMVLFLATNIVLFNVQGVGDLTDSEAGNALSAAAAPSWPGAVAEELQRLGVEPGDKVALIGYGLDAFWARLGRTPIVAELLHWDAQRFWKGDEALQADVMNAFASSGAKAVVAEYVPGDASLPGAWHQVGDSSFYIYLLGTASQ